MPRAHGRPQHRTPVQRAHQTAWEAGPGKLSRKSSDGPVAEDHPQAVIPGVSDHFNFVQRVLEATGEPGLTDATLGAWKLQGADWDDRLKEVERHVWGVPMSEAIIEAVDAELRQQAKRNERASKRTAYHAVAALLSIPAATFDAAVKQVELVYLGAKSNRDELRHSAVIGTMRVRPASGMLVRDPITMTPLPADKPSLVPNSLYWRRRLADGDVALVSD